jgi:phospholipid/cholesterol/gamma-HCH transport system substrate-binding protein
MAMMREHAGEALAGLVVVAVAAWFLVFAWNRTSSAGTNNYELVARFPNVAGVSVGSDVRVSGMKVGRVSGQRLDPETFEAVVTLSLDGKVKLPSDSAAAITSESLLGGSYVALIPGGEEGMLGPGDEILETQGATDLMGLVGSFINRSGGSGSEAP